MKIENLEIIEESNGDIHIHIRDNNNKQVEPNEEDTIKSEDNLEITEESNDDILKGVEDNNNKQVESSEEETTKSDESDLESYLKEELAALPKDDFIFKFVLIFKVSEKYRKVKEESYTPRVVSIGPLHHGKSHLQAMEGFKLRCLNELIIEHNISLKELSEFAASSEPFVRACYQDFNYNPKEFSKMILLDGIFIILVIANHTKLYGKVADMLFMGQNNWMASDVQHDMLLLENQLPLFFVTELLEKLNFQKNELSYNFREGLRTYFKEVGITHRLQQDDKCAMACHLVDFLLTLHQPRPSNTEHRNTSEQQEAGVCFCPGPLGRLLRLRLLSNKEQVTSLNAKSENTESTSEQVTSTEQARSSISTRNTSEIQEAGVCFCPGPLGRWVSVRLHLRSNKEQVKLRNARSEYTRTSSELHKAGVHFSHDPSGGLFTVSFDKDTGKLRIPQLTVNDTTETFFRNLIAFEQCGYTEKFITSYIILMDSLINTTEDVELLVKYEIIENLLGENHLVADLFNNLHKEVIEEGRDFYFADICKDLNEYSKDCFHQWRSSCFKWQLILKNKYFSNPWSVISFIAATIVVVLTIVQTGFAIAGPK